MLCISYLLYQVNTRKYTLHSQWPVGTKAESLFGNSYDYMPGFIKAELSAQVALMTILLMCPPSKIDSVFGKRVLTYWKIWGK